MRRSTVNRYGRSERSGAAIVAGMAILQAAVGVAVSEIERDAVLEIGALAAELLYEFNAPGEGQFPRRVISPESGPCGLLFGEIEALVVE